MSAVADEIGAERTVLQVFSPRRQRWPELRMISDADDDGTSQHEGELGQ